MHYGGPITDDLLDMFPDEVIVEPFISSDSHGESIFGTARTLRARVIGRMRSTFGVDAQEFVQQPQATFPGEYGLTANDRYTLPVRFSTNPGNPDDLYARQPRAIAVDRATDEDGPHHQIVYFSVMRVRGF